MRIRGLQPDFVKAARELQPLIEAHAAEGEATRRLPDAVAEALAGANLYRLAAPRVFHGAECDPMTQIEVIEAVSQADGSAGWNLMIGIEAFGLVSPALVPCQELIEPLHVVIAAATSATGRAERVAGGYRVSGQWPFASGCHNSHVFAGTVALYEGDRALDEPLRFAVVTRDEFEILDTWNVQGMRGSGSHDVRVLDCVLPEERVVERKSTGPGETVPLQRIPVGVRLAYNKVGVGLGIARGALDCFRDLAQGKTPRFASTKLRERPFAQRAIAEAEARLRSARALVFELAEEIWETVCRRERVEDEQRALFQIACSDAVTACVEAVDRVAEAAGTTANQVGHPLERRIRDVRVVPQHITVARQHIEDAGRILLGLEPRGIMLEPNPLSGRARGA